MGMTSSINADDGRRCVCCLLTLVRKLCVIVVSGMPCCCLCVTISIVIAIAALRSGCSCLRFTIVIAIVRFRSDCSLVALGQKDVLAILLIVVGVSTLLLMIKNC